MRAIAIDVYGGQERLQLMDLPFPEIGPDDVLIRMRAAGVNPDDISIPAIMGSDFVGTGDAATLACAWQGGFDGRLRRNRGWHPEQLYVQDATLKSI